MEKCHILSLVKTNSTREGYRPDPQKDLTVSSEIYLQQIGATFIFNTTAVHPPIGIYIFADWILRSLLINDATLS